MNIITIIMYDIVYTILVSILIIADIFVKAMLIIIWILFVIMSTNEEIVILHIFIIL
jgi:hypothetical protein